MRWLKLWWPALLWALLISSFSTDQFTSENTRHFIVPILHWLFPSASIETLDFLHHIIRKSAHFAEYFVLSLLILRGIRAGRHAARLGWALAAVAIVGGYAASTSITNRSFRDVLQRSPTCFSTRPEESQPRRLRHW